MAVLWFKQTLESEVGSETPSMDMLDLISGRTTSIVLHIQSALGCRGLCSMGTTLCFQYIGFGLCKASLH